MPATVILAAVGAGKTEAALTRLTETLQSAGTPLTKAWALLATRRQEVAFRQRLADLLPARPVYFNVEFFNFYDLYARILNLAGQPQRRIHETARPGLIRHLLADLRDEGSLNVFERVAQTPGFVRILADFLYELKQNQVYPEAFERAATTRKDAELALIYARYQSLLQRYHLVDREGEGWLALEAVRDYPAVASDVDLLVVDGYDQFTLVQAKLLRLLAQRTTRAYITLTTVPGREKTIGRRFERALGRLITADTGGELLRIEPFDATSIQRTPDLHTLTDSIFSGTPPHHAGDQGHLQLIEAPDAAAESAAILRRIKRLLLNGERPDEILIALRDLERYQSHIETYGRLYDLPLLMHHSEPIANNPAIMTLLKLLDVATAAILSPGKAFRRRDVLELLRSPYLRVPGMTPELVDKLDHLSMEKQVIAGRTAWLDAIRSAAVEYDDEEGQQVEPLLTAAEESDLSLALESFFNGITPTQRRGTPAAYVIWLDNLIGRDFNGEEMDDPEWSEPEGQFTLNLPECIRDALDNDPFIASRDTAAMNTFKDILRGFLQTQELLRAISRSMIRTEVPWETFYEDVKAAITSQAAPQRTPIRSGRILVTTAADARGLPHRHVFVPGLSEGIFPAPAPEDPLYLDSERARMRAAGVLLEPQSERTADDGLFYELISLPTRTLTLSRPTVRDGKPWMPSHLWRMVRAVFTSESLKPNETRIQIGEVVAIEEAAALDEAMLALAHHLETGSPANQHVPYFAWLMQTHPELWGHVQHGQRMESRRMSREKHDEYSGWIKQPDLVGSIQVELNDKHTWSATQLNDYAQCGFRFFAKRLLKLEAFDEPEEGLDALQLGLIYHKILEETYLEIKELGMAIEPAEVDNALKILEHQSAQVFKHPPEAFRVKPSGQWQQEQLILKRRLMSLVRRDFSDSAPLVEHFGESLRYVWSTEHRFRLWIPVGGEIGKLLVTGSIDRIDSINDSLIAIDYKSGGTPIDVSKMSEGRNFQMMVYLLALHELAQKSGQAVRVGGGLFWHISNLKASGAVRLAGAVDEHEAVRSAQTYVREYLRQARGGRFLVQPTHREDSGRCSSYCEFHQFCRTSTIRNRTELHID